MSDAYVYTNTVLTFVTKFQKPYKLKISYSRFITDTADCSCQNLHNL